MPCYAYADLCGVSPSFGGDVLRVLWSQVQDVSLGPDDMRSLPYGPQLASWLKTGYNFNENSNVCISQLSYPGYIILQFECLKNKFVKPIPGAPLG